jgi:hypothetical protein
MTVGDRPRPSPIPYATGACTCVQGSCYPRPLTVYWLEVTGMDMDALLTVNSTSGHASRTQDQ